MFAVLSLALVVCMAVGLVACVKNPDNGGNSQTGNYTVTAEQWDDAMGVKNYTVTVNDKVVKYVENNDGSLISYQKVGNDGYTYYFEVKGGDVYKYHKVADKWKREKDSGLLSGNKKYRR